MEKLIKKINIEFLKENKEIIIKVAITILVIIVAFFCYLQKVNEESEQILILPGGDTLTAKAGTTEITERRISGEENQEAVNQEETEIYVDVQGAVNKPGVYVLHGKSRLYEAIDMAEGLTLEADISRINQAQLLQDGEKIYVPKVNEEFTADIITDQCSGGIKDTKININTATSEELETITGIGPSTAEKIIDYRKNHGGFLSIEDLMNVKGIGEKTFEKFKDKITI